MARPKDAAGKLLPPAHQRLKAGAIEEAIYFRLCEDRRACHLPYVRKMRIARKAIDHVIDGDKEPGFIFAKCSDGSIGGGVSPGPVEDGRGHRAAAQGRA